MYRGVVVCLVVFIIFGTLGCTDTPRYPASDIPVIVIDYDDTDNTILYLRGMSDIRYDSISFIINNEAIVKNNSFSMEHNIDLEYFELEVLVWLDDNFYYHNASYTLMLEDNIMLYEITSGTETSVVRESSLPYAQRLTKVVVDIDE